MRLSRISGVDSAAQAAQAPPMTSVPGLRTDVSVHALSPLPWEPWRIVDKYSRGAAAMSDRHYSRRKPGSPQFMPPGETVVLVAHLAVFGWWRPHPSSGIMAMNNLDGWTCTIFRNESERLSSSLILAAERALASLKACGPDGMLTYVFDQKIQSVNPGYCFKRAGWRTKGRSADGRKTLLSKPFESAGLLDLAAQARKV